MQGTCLGIVENGKAECKRQRRRIPELEHGPEHRTDKDHGSGDATNRAPAPVNIGDQLFELGNIWGVSVTLHRCGCHSYFLPGITAGLAHPAQTAWVAYARPTTAVFAA